MQLPEQNIDNMCDIVLIYPPWPVLADRAMLQNSLPPLGILSIASYLETIGHKVKVIDVHAERLSEEELRRRLRKAKPAWIGISVLTNMVIPAHKIARCCKEELKNCTVVVGGVHAEVMPERMLRNSAIDRVVRGDGEEAMKELMEGVPLDEIDGISFREGDRIVHNQARKINMDLDKYPFPAYHLVNLDNYFPAAGSYRDLPAINMLATRGCPGQCVFCNSARTVLRTRSAKRLADQITLLREKYNIRQIQFYDDTFTVLKRNVLELCRILKERNLDIHWLAFIRGDTFSEEMAAAMKAAGCHQVKIGVETGSRKIAENIGKPISKERYKKAVRIAHKYKLEVNGSFIVGNIGETVETMQETLDFAKELDIDIFRLSINTPYPGTALYTEAVRKGMLKHKNWYRYGQEEVLIEQPQITEEEIYQFVRRAYREFYLRPVMIYRLFKRMFHLRHLRDFFLAGYILLLGKHRWGKSRNLDCWRSLKEEDFLDLRLEAEEDKLRLTHEVRERIAV